MEFIFKGTSIRLVQGDITQQQAHVIVNAANAALAGGSGVDGAIHRAGGPSIAAECAELRAKRGADWSAGDVVVTGAGALPAHIVVHAIGPIWHGGGRGENTALERCYERAILASIERGHRTIAFPAISTGAYGFPLDRSALIAGNAIARLIKENPGKLDTVWMVLHGDDAFAEYRRQFALVIEEMTGTPF